jgi:hexosaminidase
LNTLNLLPCPRRVKRLAGHYSLPADAVLHLDPSLPRDSVMLPLAARLIATADEIGVRLELVTGPARHPRLAIAGVKRPRLPTTQPEAYELRIDSNGVVIGYSTDAGLRAGVATLRQLLREFGRKLPALVINDWPDFPRRGVMLDVSRGRVPNLNTLLDLADHLADLKINELQLYTEHTFAYRNFEPVWKDWGALTGAEILLLDQYCRKLGIDLVPNQNSFGHLRYWLEYPPLKSLAEVAAPYESADGSFVRYPTTLAPNSPGTLRFLRELFDELLPHFTSKYFNVGCDETWDLGRGQSKRLCERLEKGKVYVDFLRKIHREVSRRDRTMMFWGDIIMNHPELIRMLPRKVIALNWGYEASHPFERETSLFQKSRVPFYVCPGTSTWMTLIGRHDNALANLKAAAQAGKRHGAIGYLNTDWGDGGHPQPLAVSWLPYLAGAALSWCQETFDESLLVPVLSRDLFHDPTFRLAKAALALGKAHLKFGYTAPNVTPFGAVIAAPIPSSRELFCRDGLKYYARIPERNIRAAREAVETELTRMALATTASSLGMTLATELSFVARMATQSCDIMLWQQALASGKQAEAARLAKLGIKQLTQLNSEFDDFWPMRNKGTTARSSPFLRWRIEDYRRAILHFPPDQARVVKPKLNPAD